VPDGTDGGATQTLDAVTIASCSVVPTYSAPLYPAAYAIGRPGLIAVAATGATIGLAPPNAVSGTITWHAAVGTFLEQGAVVATIGTTDVSVPEAGVLVTRNVTSGNVALGQQFATILDAYQRAAYSNVSEYTTVAAPGGQASGSFGIYSTLPPTTYGYLSGTSMAAPHVTAVAALRLAKCGTSTPPSAVADAIVSTARDIGQTGWDAAFGAGIVRADAAVNAAC